MSVIPARSPQTTALTARLNSTGIAGAFGEPPSDAGWQGSPGGSAFVPYWTLYIRDGGTTDGTLAAPQADSDWLWQVTSVGATPDQCEQVADLTRSALLGTPVFVSARGVLWLKLDMPSGARPDRTVKPHVWISTEVYRLGSVP